MTTYKPFLKWAGGKRQLLDEIIPKIPKKFGTYFEPFVGAGAVFFGIQHEKAVINDYNVELINCYEVIRDDIDGLIEDLKKHENNIEYFLHIRNMDRDVLAFSKLTKTERASRIIYLNKTCFNGLYRVNSKGYFNVPFGHYKNPKIADEEMLRSIHHHLKETNITILQGDFETSLSEAKKGDFVYLDPPYDPVSKTSSFTSYSAAFGKEQQLRLKRVFQELDERGCYVMMSNSATEFIKELYQEYPIHIVKAKRHINAEAQNRGEIDEVLVVNYKV